MRNKKQYQNEGFTLIELLVVIAIIALLSSVALIAFMSARQKSRDTKRLGDMTQMNTALELYFSTYKGYPSSPVPGIPAGMAPEVLSSLPVAPKPTDGSCDSIVYPSPVPGGHTGADYYYYPSGTSFLSNGILVYNDYAYYFCLGDKTGDYAGGMRILTPKGLR